MTKEGKDRGDLEYVLSNYQFAQGLAGQMKEFAEEKRGDIKSRIRKNFTKLAPNTTDDKSLLSGVDAHRKLADGLAAERYYQHLDDILEEQVSPEALESLALNESFVKSSPDQLRKVFEGYRNYVKLADFVEHYNGSGSPRTEEEAKLLDNLRKKAVKNIEGRIKEDIDKTYSERLKQAKLDESRVDRSLKETYELVYRTSIKMNMPEVVEGIVGQELNASVKAQEETYQKLDIADVARESLRALARGNASQFSDSLKYVAQAEAYALSKEKKG